MTELPLLLPERLQVDARAHAVSAYNKCLRVENSLQQAVNNGKIIGNDFIYIRILGYLIHFVPTDMGLKVVVNEVTSAKSDEALLNIGKMYFDHFIRPFRATKVRTPALSSYASRASSDTIADMLKDTLEEAPQSYSTAKKHALIRDGFRCVVTGRYDVTSVLANKELREKLNEDHNLDTVEETRCSHIFAQFTDRVIDPGTPKRDYAATISTVMTRFGYTQLPDDLNGPNVHRLENVMTVIPGFRSKFDQLKIWFVATNIENRYKLEATERFLLKAYPEYVTFKTPDPVKYPVPSAVYLAIHAACAKVAHLSGANACIDKFYRDMDNSTILDPNGAPAELLERAILEIQIAGRPINIAA